MSLSFFVRAFIAALLSLSAACLSVVPAAFAQSRGSDPIDVSVEPEAPAPGESTTISLTSMTLDLSQATISWSLDGAEKASSVGQRTFTFTMGAAGKSTAVGLTIVPVRGSRTTRTFTFHPASVLLLWEADTYTPPLYKGRALYSGGAGVRILAVPSVIDGSGALVSPSDLNFRWEIEDEAYADRSGLGHDLLLISGSQLRGAETVSVTVLRRDGTKAASSRIVIPATSPLVRFYKVDPLRGTRYERSLIGDVSLTDTETTIVAEPYFISGSTKTSTDFANLWRLNGADVTPEGRDRSVITLRQQGATNGNAQLEFSIQNTSYEKLLQNASAAINLVLSSNTSSSVF